MEFFSEMQKNLRADPTAALAYARVLVPHQVRAVLVTLGGEGAIVRDPEAEYLAGRRPEILKVKSFQDAEAVVIGHLPGQGKNAGLLGALLVELPDGTRFRIGAGFSAAQRRNPPPLGTTVTFKHHDRYRSGLPKFPVFLRIRYDLGL